VDKKVLVAAIGGLVGMDADLLNTVAAAQSAKYGIKARVGQYVRDGVDQSERINFDKSRYIPGNGPSHRLGRKAS
jgi:uncharacterized membrane protein